jgi:glycosyltransferase involved in cell wall biosynthesis
MGSHGSLRDSLVGSIRRIAPRSLQRALRRGYHIVLDIFVWPPAFWQRHVDPAFARRIAVWRAAGEHPRVSIVVVTFNRLRMLRECLASLLEQTSGTDFEVIVWDNASTDGTGEYLDELASEHPDVLRIVHSEVNIGMNAMAEGVKLTRGFYIVEVDDDVVRFPEDWLPRMVRAYDRVPRAGYLSTNVVQDEKTNGGRDVLNDLPVRDYGDGVVIEEGGTGGWCAITSLRTLARIGNFQTIRGRICFGEDGDFTGRCVGAGLGVGVIRDIYVYHACGAQLNYEYGCLDVLVQKYSDGPGNAAGLEAARSVIDSQTPGE